MRDLLILCSAVSLIWIIAMLGDFVKCMVKDDYYKQGVEWYIMLTEELYIIQPLFRGKNSPENARIYKLVQKCFGIFSKKLAE